MEIEPEQEYRRGTEAFLVELIPPHVMPKAELESNVDKQTRSFRSMIFLKEAGSLCRFSL